MEGLNRFDDVFGGESSHNQCLLTVSRHLHWSSINPLHILRHPKPATRNLLCFIISLSEAPDLLRDRTGKGPFLRPDIHLYLATHTEPPAFRRRAPNTASTCVR